MHRDKMSPVSVLKRHERIRFAFSVVASDTSPIYLGVLVLNLYVQSSIPPFCFWEEDLKKMKNEASTAISKI